MNELTNINNIKTMSSLEIAKLTEKRHDHVLRDIEKMLEKIWDSGILAAPNFGVSDLDSYKNKFLNSYKDSTNRSLKLYNLPKIECLALVAGYDDSLRYKIIKRWDDLENTISESKLFEILSKMQKEIASNQKDNAEIKKMLLEQNSNLTALMNNMAIQHTLPSPADDISNYFRVVEYGELFYSHIPKSTHMDNAKALGGLVSSISKKLGLKVVQVQNGKYPANTYHKSALKEAYTKFYN